MLAERTSQILVHIIGEYVDTALPVGSETIVRKYRLPISAATGALAVLGPTRMRYSRVIPAVRYLSSLMGERVARLC
jgi:transcriptional regulator of heat shock response